MHQTPTSEWPSAYDRQFFLNQFLLTDTPVPALAHWNIFSVGVHRLYCHPELEVSEKIEQNNQLIILGYVYDYRNPKASNRYITQQIQIIGSHDEVIKQLESLCGVYVVLWRCGNQLVFIPDMCSLREVYIHCSPSMPLVAGSSPNILRLTRQIHDRPQASNKLYGHLTAYKDVVRLTPNHYFDSMRVQQIRFFPVAPQEKSSISETSELQSIIFKGVMEAVASRDEKIVTGLTSGWDSRIILAASRSVIDRLIFFVKYIDRAPQSDRAIPLRLAQRLKFTFMKVYLSGKKENMQPLPYTYTTGYQENDLLRNLELKRIFGECKMVNGTISEIARNFYAEVGLLNGAKLARFSGITTDEAIAYYNTWLENNEKLFSSYSYRVLDMFYWEEVLFNRIGKIVTEGHAVNIHYFSPYNCRLLMKNLLSLPLRYRSKEDNSLYTSIIQNLWPEVLTEPINPSIKRRVIRTMQRLNIYQFYSKRIFLIKAILKRDKLYR